MLVLESFSAKIAAIDFIVFEDLPSERILKISDYYRVSVVHFKSSQVKIKRVYVAFSCKVRETFGLPTSYSTCYTDFNYH